MNSVSENLGAFVAVKAGNVPIASAGATRNSAGFDRLALGFDSCVLAVAIGAATGAPTSYAADTEQS
jgi:hypothetical protein